MMKHKILITLTLILTAGLGLLRATEVIEEIYAVVNGELITYFELHNAEQEWARNLQSRFQGEELETALKRMKAELMDTFIERKLLISKAKEKNYDIDNDVDVMIKEIMKQNHFDTEEQLKAALQKEGLNIKTFREQQKLFRMQQRLVYEEITSKIKIDNAEIMTYFKENVKKFTIPTRYDLNAIYLKPDKYTSREALKSRAEEISAALENSSFSDVASKYTDLGEKEKSIHLGEFNSGEMDPNLEKAAQALQEKSTSEWIESESGWYLLQLIKMTPSHLVSYEDVRDDIRRTLLQERHGPKQREYIEKLKKESYIKIYKRWK